MKFLFDENISHRILKKLDKQFETVFIVKE